jgi:hypothetical protein
MISILRSAYSDRVENAARAREARTTEIKLMPAR